ncbi:MAG: hypothetical protein ACYCVV_19810, partial [Acidimicrobiales bacterium]
TIVPPGCPAIYWLRSVAQPRLSVLVAGKIRRRRRRKLGLVGEVLEAADLAGFVVVASDGEPLLCRLPADEEAVAHLAPIHAGRLT